MRAQTGALDFQLARSSCRCPRGWQAPLGRFGACQTSSVSSVRGSTMWSDVAICPYLDAPNGPSHPLEKIAGSI